VLIENFFLSTRQTFFMTFEYRREIGLSNYLATEKANTAFA
jgi:hypothetical protein